MVSLVPSFLDYFTLQHVGLCIFRRPISGIDYWSAGFQSQAPSPGLSQSKCLALKFAWIGITGSECPIMSDLSLSPTLTAANAAPIPDHKHTRCSSDANIRNFAPVARIMKLALPENAKIAKEAKECMQECVSEFISFITSEGTRGTSAKCRHR